MQVLLKFAGLSIAFQIGAIISAILLVPFSSQVLIALMYFYLPTILLVESTGNFVGCANMIAPLMYGIPLGVVSYSLLTGYSVRIIKHLTGLKS